MMNISLAMGIPLHRFGGDPYAALRKLYGDWPVDMMISYIDINDHNEFSDVQKDLIASRLAESYVETTFGPDGLNKTVCNFFLFLENSNTTSAITTASSVKTGSTPRWNYGDSNVYSQVNLPAEICNGVVTVTSEDGFGSWTLFHIEENTWINYCPSPKYFTTLYRWSVYNCTFSGNVPSFRDNSNVNILYLNDNLFTGGDFSYAGLTKLSNLILKNTFFLSEEMNFFDLTGCVGLTQVTIGGSAVQGQTAQWRGRFPEIPAPGLKSITAPYGKITGVDIETFSVATTILNFQSNLLSTEEVGLFIKKVSTFFTANAPTANCTVSVDGIGNGALIGDESNADLIALKAAYVSAGYVCTVNYNEEATRFAAGGYLVISTDDLKESSYNIALPALNSRSLLGTFYCISDRPTLSGYCTWAEIKSIQDSGHEIGSHSKTHQSLAGLSDTELRVEFDGVATAFAANDINVASTIAYPFGQSDALARSVATEYYTAGRTATQDIILPGEDKFLLDIRNIDLTTQDDIQAVKDWVLKVKYGQHASAFLFHDVVESGATASQINETEFLEILDYVVSSGITVVMMKDLIPLMD